MKKLARDVLTQPIDRRSLLAGVVLPAAAYLGVRAVWPESIPDPTPLSRSVDSAEGENLELVAILVSSSTCAGNTYPGFLNAARRVPWLIQERGLEAGMAHYLMGVAIDPVAAEGWRYLEDIGEFHEVVVGGGWANTGALRYIWEGGHLSPHVPQLLVLRRTTLLSSQHVSVSEVTILRHLDSPEALVGWVGDGAPLEVAT